MSIGPIPEPTPETLAFWQGTAAGELRIQRCRACENFYFYPRPFCPKCNSDEVEWQPVSGKAQLASYIINYRPYEDFQTEEPQIIALVTLAEGPRMCTNIVGVAPDPDQLPLGLALQVAFEPRGEQFLPVFKPARS
ncbi:Zn-ribbon domain-containing OB-fold protein [Sphingopyxis chilensis]|uniref:Zn-ribbon domain-containing OB-fold protein n=1 Tax=Sphingopyxis chilensis TaxID=180400 RepID=UPI002DDD0566|nr:OB-fold domain-containing protein [Sphingopyxis chilensis]